MADTRRHRDVEPAHPGEILAEIAIPATAKSKVEIAKLLGISRQSLYDILGKRQSVTPKVAVRLGKLFGDGPGVWLRMQQAHDLWHAERALAEEVKAIPTLKAA
jgi:antitoxin HigA-1